MGRSLLETAERDYRRRRYAQAIRRLEPMVMQYRESSAFYRLLGMACLQANDQGGAQTYLRRALQLQPGDRDCRLGLAAIDLRRRDIQSALRAYLDIIDEDPKDKLARRGLESIRRMADESSLSAFIESGAVRALYPTLPARPARVILIAAFIIFAACALWLGYMGIRALVQGRRELRSGARELVLSPDELAAPLGQAQAALYRFTQEEALSTYQKALKLFSEYRDNLAVREANRILNSNASEALRAKAALIKDYAREPSFSDIKDVPGFSDVYTSPALYESCAVAWKGVAANLAIVEGKTAFDLMVGYHDRKRLEGIIPCRGAQAGAFGPDEPIEVLAYVRTGAQGPWLEVLAVHLLAY
jgi:tetratricopeptide (TPR) repeat protein